MDCFPIHSAVLALICCDTGKTASLLVLHVHVYKLRFLELGSREWPFWFSVGSENFLLTSNAELHIYEAYAHAGGKTNGAGERANAGVLLYSSLSTYSVWVLHVYQVQMLADSSLHTAVTLHASGQWHPLYSLLALNWWIELGHYLPMHSQYSYWYSTSGLEFSLLDISWQCSKIVTACTYHCSISRLVRSNILLSLHYEECLKRFVVGGFNRAISF